MNSSDMEVTINNNGDKTNVTIDGRIDNVTVEAFQQSMNTLIEGNQQDIEIDCSALSYTSSQGLRIFLILQKSVTKRGGKLVLSNMNAQVKEVFDITGFSNIIKIV